MVEKVVIAKLLTDKMIHDKQEDKAHTKQEEEKEAFALLMNHALGDDDQCKMYLPINPYDQSLYDIWGDGLMLA